jgi:hypothetical protein
MATTELLIDAERVKGFLNLDVTIPATEDHSAGITRVDVEINDKGTLVTGQTYRAGYFRYNVQSTVPSNPTAEVTGMEGVAASYITDVNLTLRGGYFRTYISTDTVPLATGHTSIGCEISARASYNGGTPVTASGGTAFVGARIWMAPYFTAGSIANVNNSHALWIINEAPNTAWVPYIDRAITVDATTYGAAFNYAFYADSGKIYLHLNGALAGSGVKAGERDASAGDNWATVLVDDYRTLVTGQTYDATLSRYNVRSTTPGAPQEEVNGVEGVVGYYILDGNLSTIRGGYFRTYLDTDSHANNAVKTNIGCEISARASYAGGTAATALAGSAFVGARIWMAPYFTAPSVGNVNNFWGLWIFGEHASQRNADAAIYISDAGGGFTDAIRIAGGYPLTFNGSQDSGVPVAAVSLGAYDLAAGHRALAVSSEEVPVNAAAGVSDWYVNVRWNGATYKLLLHS